jgi:proteasome assembly chaperone (PAC2) family protein
MGIEALKISTQPRLNGGNMVLAFSGWMDGGNVSTGTVDWLVNALGARRVAAITPDPFYIYSFPGPMELSSLFRPHTEIANGIIKTYQPPQNVFFCDSENALLFFSGKEPHFQWGDFAECLFSFAKRSGISALYFIGSVAGAVPHTRESYLFSAVSEETMRTLLEPYGVRFTDYEGPASFATYMMTQAASRGFRMASLVAQIPAYIQGTNPKSIEAMTRTLSAILGLRLNLDELRTVTDLWEKRVNEVLDDEHDLAKYIGKLEEDYDNEVFDTQMGDLKEWLEQRGIRVD